MDVQTIDQTYQQLQGQSQQTVQALQTLGNKLQTAAGAGDQQAREWLLDLRELALSFRSEQDQVSNLLQALHGFVASQAQFQAPVQQAAPPPQQGGAWGQSPSFTPQPGYSQQQPSYGQAGGFTGGGAPGGMIGNFLNSGFGRAIEMGAGFGIGDELINKIF
nr:hypothetical protein [uncultured Lichenicoccus sp.]